MGAVLVWSYEAKISPRVFKSSAPPFVCCDTSTNHPYLESRSVVSESLLTYGKIRARPCRPSDAEAKRCLNSNYNPMVTISLRRDEIQSRRSGCG